MITRRGLLQAGAVAGATFALDAAGASAAVGRAPTRRTTSNAPPSVTATFDFNQGWRFGGAYRAGSQTPGYSDAGFRHVNLPHTAVDLSWGNWNPASWEQLWIYRKRFTPTVASGARVLLDFEGVMTNATVYLNGFELATHLGGFLPFTVELTGNLLPGENDLGVVVDGRLLDVPPLGNAGGAIAIDYVTPAGIYRDVTLRVVPDTFISDVFAKPVNVLTNPALDVRVSVDSLNPPSEPLMMTVELLDGRRTLRSATIRKRFSPGTNVIALDLNGLSGIKLWSPASPKLYAVRVTLTGDTVPPHTVTVTTGFRDARFDVSGFYLNGQRLQIVGLNRHQLFPYTGMAAPARLQARDAALLKQELGCNMVRCSHYPQSPHFLDACDQLGLMVWEEAPGWEYVGDQNFEAIFLQNVRDMVTRDRNRPSVIVWGTRLDETASYPTLYAEARQLAYELDGSRQTSGAMNTHATTGWSEDVFGDNDYGSTDYGATDANAQIAPPLPGLPYVITEAVGAVSGPPLFRWIDSSATLQAQARLHSQVHEQARTNPQYSGVLAWCGIDYASLGGGPRNWLTLRWPGVLDTFRVPKPGASFYRSQLSPQVAPVILPAFYWDFGPNSPPLGPGPNSMFATNCDQLMVFVDNVPVATAAPATSAYANAGNPPLYPPVFVDLTVLLGATTLPTLTVHGYLGGTLLATLNMASDTSGDRLGLDLADSEIVADGTDATRLTFRALDMYGNQRPYVTGDVTLYVTGPAVLVGQNPFAFQEYGGVGGVLLRSQVGQTGKVTITATHPTLGTATANLRVVAPTGRYL